MLCRRTRKRKSRTTFFCGGFNRLTNFRHAGNLAGPNAIHLTIRILLEQSMMAEHRAMGRSE
jgi:hypothetical protein